MSAARRTERLDLAIDFLTQAEDILEELGMKAELSRLISATDSVVCERDHVVLFELPEVAPRAFAGIYQPQLERK